MKKIPNVKANNPPSAIGETTLLSLTAATTTMIAPIAMQDDPKIMDKTLPAHAKETQNKTPNTSNAQASMTLNMLSFFIFNFPFAKNYRTLKLSFNSKYSVLVKIDIFIKSRYSIHEVCYEKVNT